MQKFAALIALPVILLTLSACGSGEDRALAFPKETSNATSNTTKLYDPGTDTSSSVTATTTANTGNKSGDSAEAPVRPADAYLIVPGDVLQVSVWKEEALDREAVVLPDGSINFPLVGSVSVKDKTPAEVQDDIKQKLHRFVPDASVSVTVKAPLGHTVSVIGQVQKPGEIVMDHRMTVMQALSQAGGLTPYANEGHVMVLRRNGEKETSIRVPYSGIARGEDLDQDIVLKPGDVVVVSTAGLL